MTLKKASSLTTIVLAAGLATSWSDGVCAAEETVRVTFRESDDVFANPGKGWMTGRRSPGQEQRLPYSVAYIRVCWNDLEPEEGRIVWEIFDKPIEAWKEQNVRIAFRVMTANAHTRGYYCSPKWLFDAGCKSYDYVRGGEDTMSGGKRIARIEPDYGDPVFLEKHANLIRKLGERYDGHPRVEFIDIGSYGIWGEWHTSNGKPWDVRKRIIDMYLEAFPNTPLAQMSDDAEALAYAIGKGAGFRRDGIGSPWHEKTWIGSKKYARVQGFADVWKRAPVVFEWFGPYDFLVRREWSFDSAVNFVLANHLTFINDNLGKVPDDQMPKLERLARLAGYRFVLREASHPAEVAPGGRLSVRMKWSNVGVGRLIRPHPMVLYLLDTEGKIATRMPQAEVDVSAWLPGDHQAAGRLDVPASLPPGEYTLAVALVDPDTNEPAIRLAVEVAAPGRLHQISRVTIR